MNINRLILCNIVFLFLFAAIANAEQPCDLFFFYSKTCPHCANEKIFLNEVQQKYPQIDMQYIEVSENYEFFKQTSEAYNTIPVGVPRTFIDDKVFIGFTEESGPLEYVKGYQAYSGYKNQIEKAINEHLAAKHNITDSFNETCVTEPIKQENVRFIFIPLLLLFLYAMFFVIARKKIEKRYLIGTLFAIIIIVLFYLSQHLPSTKVTSFAQQFTFPFFTFIIALIDGFNPCAFAVLAILLSLLAYARSKRKMALIGIIFIITSAVMYFLFIIILLLLRTELLGAHKNIVRIIVGIIALIAGSINIKDFFFFKKGISLTISQEKMTGLVAKMRNIVNEVKEAKTARAMLFAVIATIILAALVNLIELGCTLILPIQYLEVLITNYGTYVTARHYAYIAFYSVVYIIPLFAILGSFLYSFKSERITEAKGRLLKLIGGLVMIGLGLILLFKPGLIFFG